MSGFPRSLSRQSAPCRIFAAYAWAVTAPQLRADVPVLASTHQPDDASSGSDYGGSFAFQGTELLHPDQLRRATAGKLGRVLGMIKRSEPTLTAATCPPPGPIGPMPERGVTRVLSPRSWGGPRRRLVLGTPALADRYRAPIRSLAPDSTCSNAWTIHYRESERSALEDRIVGWVICTHEAIPEIHPVVICEGPALCAETALRAAQMALVGNST